MRVAPCAPTHALAMTTSLVPSASTSSGQGPSMPAPTPSTPQQVPINDAAWEVNARRPVQDLDVTRKRVEIEAIRTKRRKRTPAERGTRLKARQDNANCASRLSFPSRCGGGAVVIVVRTITANTYLHWLLDPACNTFGNDVWSCYPTSTTIVPQEQWSKFICLLTPKSSSTGPISRSFLSREQATIPTHRSWLS